MKLKIGKKEAKIKKKLDRFRDKLKTEEDYYKEAYRYYENAKERLKTSPIEYNRYQDAKPVREACGTAYLATLLALDGYFISRGVPNAELPDATDTYIAFLKEFLVHNGKVTQAFHTVWENLHVFGYYRGGINVDMIKAGFREAKLIIDTLAKTKSINRNER